MNPHCFANEHFIMAVVFQPFAIQLAGFVGLGESLPIVGFVHFAILGSFCGLQIVFLARAPEGQP